MKKGFTLIELLAVIVILAVIALIATPVVLNIINDVRSSAELESARTLVNLANNYIATEYLHGAFKKEEQVFVIIDDIEYQIEKDGSKIQTSNFKHKGKLCDYCVVKISDDKKVSILYEGVNQDIIKEYDSSEFIKKELKQSRKIMSLYNELILFKDKYVMNNTVDDEIYFEFSDGVINKVNKYGKVDAESNILINPNLKESGEFRINSSNQIAIVIYDDNNNIKCDYGSNEFYSESIKYSRDVITLVKNLSRLELLAEEYTSGNKTTSDWLVFYYIRSLKYNSSIYDVVTGADINFVSYVQDEAKNLETYFTNKNTYTVNGHEIDLKHMAASLAGNLYDSPAAANLLFEELEYDCVVSWAGDLHTLMEQSILKTGVKEQYGNYLDATYNLMGKSNTSFSMEDVYADLDAWILYYNMKENTNLSIEEIFEKYYSGESSRSYKNRYTSFISIMNTIATQFNSSKVNFEGVVSHFTSDAKKWPTIGTLEITPTSEERQEIADGFIKWIKEQASKE